MAVGSVALLDDGPMVRAQFQVFLATIGPTDDDGLLLAVHTGFLDARVIPLLRDPTRVVVLWDEDAASDSKRVKAAEDYLFKNAVTAAQVQVSQSAMPPVPVASPGTRVLDVMVQTAPASASPVPGTVPTAWTALIPDAAGGSTPPQASSGGFTTAHGPLTDYAIGADSQPATTYVKGVTAAPLATGVTAAQVDAAVNGIRAARAQIRRRYLVLHNIPRGDKQVPRGQLGFEAGPSLDSNPGTPGGLLKKGAQAVAFQKEDPSWQEIADASTAYLVWLGGAATKPSQVTDVKDMVWRAFRRMCEWEGMPSAVNTWDQIDVTFGAGFAATGGKQQKVGQAQELLEDLCARSALAKSLLSNAGLVMDGPNFVVVDPAQKWKLRGMDAELYLRSNRDLLSLYINVGQGVFVDSKSQTAPKDELRQATLDANYTVFLKHSAKGVSSGQLGSDVGLAALKLHAPHSGHFNFSEVSGFGSVAALVGFIYGKISRPLADAVVPGEFRHFAPPP